MTDTYRQFHASAMAQAKVQDLLAAAEDILKHGNALYNDLRDGDAYADAALANVRVTHALIDIFKIVKAIDVEA